MSRPTASRWRNCRAPTGSGRCRWRAGRAADRRCRWRPPCGSWSIGARPGRCRRLATSPATRPGQPGKHLEEALLAMAVEPGQADDLAGHRSPASPGLRAGGDDQVARPKGQPRQPCASSAAVARRHRLEQLPCGGPRRAPRSRTTLAAAQDGNPVGERHHLVHAMGDEQDQAAFRGQLRASWRTPPRGRRSRARR